jgi:CubicO group peptidase (beta-lactamase class C family)
LKRGLNLLLLALLMFLATTPAALAQYELSDSEIETILRLRVQLGKGVGMVAGIVDEKGPRVVAFGHPNKQSTQNLDGDSVFEIGSISKVFTTTLLADMAERGEARLYDPVSKFLPASVFVPVRNGKEITLKDLATHSSGLPRMPGNFAPNTVVARKVLGCPFCGFDKVVPELFERYSVEDMYRELSNYRLTRDIGSKFEYSNWGVALLGHVLALRAGMEYEALMKTRIAQPLQMDHTAVVLTAGMKEHLATAHNKDGKPTPNWDMPRFAGAGGIRSTANDLIKFMQANLGLIPSPLSAAMQRAQQPAYQCCGKHPEVEMGLGWFFRPQFNGKIIEHSGSTGGYESVMLLDTDKRRGVVILANSSIFIRDIAHHLLDSQQYPIADDPKRRKAIPIDPAVLAPFTGDYQLRTEEVLSITSEGDKLFAAFDGKKKVQIFPETPNRFFWRIPDAKDSMKVRNVRATFVTNGNGQVTHLVLHRESEYVPAAKIR